MIRLNAVDDCKMIADYVIEYGEVKRVLPYRCQILEEKVDGVLVFLKMLGYKAFNLNHVFEYMCVEKWYSEIEETLEMEHLELIEPKLREIIRCVNKIEVEFQKQTGISIYRSYVKVEKHFYFEMKREDVVQLTPQAQKLKDSGIQFDFQQFLDEN